MFLSQNMMCILKPKPRKVFAKSKTKADSNDYFWNCKSAMFEFLKILVVWLFLPLWSHVLVRFALSLTVSEIAFLVVNARQPANLFGIYAKSNQIAGKAYLKSLYRIKDLKPRCNLLSINKIWFLFSKIWP